MSIVNTLSGAPLPEVSLPGNCLRPGKEDVCRVDVEQVNAFEFTRVSDVGLRSIQRETELKLPANSGKLMNDIKLLQPTLSVLLSSTLPAMEYLIEFTVIMAHNLTAQNMHHSFADDWQTAFFILSISQAIQQACTGSSDICENPTEEGTKNWTRYVDVLPGL
ncbi:Hypothetical predicted protein [Paramuricea clavata]|uniref:Uncharacterized protein n=1 Tax=Paramuricea clavata TaxID=317549 RepID=A0A6S7GX71_PARCT|nr:Hypothetical predicted protein [Paramuricea clavata]